MIQFHSNSMFYVSVIMPPRRVNARRANAGNANTAPPVPDQQVSNAKFRNAIQMLAQSMANQNNQRVQAPVNANVGQPQLGFIPIELREARAQKFMNLRQGNMTVQKYGLKFNQLSRYDPHMVADSRARLNKFLYGVSDLVKTECRNAMLLGDMNISRLMTHSQQVRALSIQIALRSFSDLQLNRLVV
ncbi:hypothetical protein MTR67_002276, partial [Solanum verrucosum]